MMRALLLSLVVVTGACTGDDEVIPADAPRIDAPEVPVADAPTVDGPIDAALATDGGPDAAASCGGFAGLTCEANLYCDFPDDGCGGDDGTGTCAAPESCTGPQPQVCACDGNVYADRCAAQEAGFDVSLAGGCTAPSGTFACGYLFCDPASEYCEIIVSDVVGYPDTYACRPLPGTCGSPATCGCLVDENCGDWCTEGGTGELTATCPGG